MKMRKAIVAVSSLAACFMLTARLARADQVTFHDLSDRLTVDGNRIIFADCVISRADSCFVFLQAPSGTTFSSSSSNLTNTEYLIGEGNGTVSDTIGVAPLGVDVVTILFVSNPATETDLGRCPNAGCNITENGLVQNTGLTISWVGSSGTVQDTIAFESDISEVPSAAPTPEPSSLLLLGTGLLGIVGAVRRKWLG